MYFFSNVLHIQRVRRDGARSFGQMFHAGLDAWWRAMDGGDVPWRDADAALVQSVRAIHDASKHIDTDAFERARAEAMMTVYHFRHFELDFETVPIAGTVAGDGGVEQAFKLPLVDEHDRPIKDWFVTGRTDACKRFADGKIKVAEHKTSKSDIAPGSLYWIRLRVDTQVSVYVDVAQRSGLDVHEAFYDVSRTIESKPKLATPDDKQRMSKGKGCPHCGGRKGGKLGVAQGTGKIIVVTKVDAEGRALPKAVEVETACTSCDGTGWHEAPKLDARQRTEDEDVEEFKRRVMAELADEPETYFKTGYVPRSADQLAESRADLVATSGEIQTLLNWARAESDGDMREVRARRCFPRNDGACGSQYGRPCEYLPVCSGAEDIFQSPHYAPSTPPWLKRAAR